MNYLNYFFVANLLTFSRLSIPVLINFSKPWGNTKYQTWQAINFFSIELVFYLYLLRYIPNFRKFMNYKGKLHLEGEFYFGGVFYLRNLFIWYNSTLVGAVV